MILKGQLSDGNAMDNAQCMGLLQSLLVQILLGMIALKLGADLEFGICRQLTAWQLPLQLQAERTSSQTQTPDPSGPSLGTSWNP